MFDKLKNLFAPKEEAAKIETPKKPREKKQPELTLKEKATQAGEPYINVIGMELNPENIHEGAFELDWNSIFITRLVKSGYMKKKEDTDQDIVDRWFQDVCRNVALEMYEQKIADPDLREVDLRNIRQRDLGDGRTEVS